MAKITDIQRKRLAILRVKRSMPEEFPFLNLPSLSIGSDNRRMTSWEMGKKNGLVLFKNWKNKTKDQKEDFLTRMGAYKEDFRVSNHNDTRQIAEAFRQRLSKKLATMV